MSYKETLIKICLPAGDLESVLSLLYNKLKRPDKIQILILLLDLLGPQHMFFKDVSILTG